MPLDDFTTELIAIVDFSFAVLLFVRGICMLVACLFLAISSPQIGAGLKRFAAFETGETVPTFNEESDYLRRISIFEA